MHWKNHVNRALSVDRRKTLFLCGVCRLCCLALERDTCLGHCLKRSEGDLTNCRLKLEFIYRSKVIKVTVRSSFLDMVIQMRNSLQLQDLMEAHLYPIKACLQRFFKDSLNKLYILQISVSIWVQHSVNLRALYYGWLYKLLAKSFLVSKRLAHNLSFDEISHG